MSRYHVVYYAKIYDEHNQLVTDLPFPARLAGSYEDMLTQVIDSVDKMSSERHEVLHAVIETRVEWD